MDFMTMILAPTMWPSGMWESLIKWFSGIGNVAVGVILLTICLKIVLLPLDFWQKMVSRKMQVQQALMQPEIDEIKKKYADNPTVLQQKQAEVYRKHNMSPANSCLAMFAYMVVTMLVFFTLFSGLGNISRSQINYEYYTLEQTYSAKYIEEIGNGKTEDEAKQIAQDEVVVKYDQIRQGFLTIKNVWRPDNKSSVFPSANEFVSTTKTNFTAFKYEPANITYLVLSTDMQVFEDINGENYLEPYMDLNGTVYAVFDTSDTATNPSTFTIQTTDGDLEFLNVVYTDVFAEYENTDLGISYLYKVAEKNSTYTKDEATYIMPYIIDGKIYATVGELAEVEINGKTYQVVAGATQADLLPEDAKEAMDLYATSTASVGMEQFVADFETVTAGINEKYKGQWNGYLILVALSGLITFLSSFLATAGMRTKDKKGNEIKARKPKPTMGIILSVVMILFTISYTSVFALYIITNSLISMLLNYLTNLLLNKIEVKQEKIKEAGLPDYVRR